MFSQTKKPSRLSRDGFFIWQTFLVFVYQNKKSSPPPFVSLRLDGVPPHVLASVAGSAVTFPSADKRPGGGSSAFDLERPAYDAGGLRNVGAGCIWGGKRDTLHLFFRDYGGLTGVIVSHEIVLSSTGYNAANRGSV